MRNDEVLITPGELEYLERDPLTAQLIDGAREVPAEMGAGEEGADTVEIDVIPCPLDLAGDLPFDDLPVPERLFEDV